MLLTDSEMMREADRNAFALADIPTALLMRNAGDALALSAAEMLAPGETAAVFCGTGNNGGDGIAAAAKLLCMGFEARVYLVGKREKLSPDAKEMESCLLELGGALTDLPAEDPDISDCAAVIDALFGTGLSRPVEGDALRAVRLMNGSGLPVVSCDIPSGISADTGAVLGEAVRADVTVTFAMPKVGHYAAPGCLYCGDVRTADIGIPYEFLCGCGVQAVMREDVSILPRAKDAHKGDFGRVLVLGGSVGLTGAPTMSAKAALRTGAGLVSVGVPEPIYGITAVKNDEAMPFPLAADPDGKLSAAALPVILDRLKKADVCVLGPGLGRSEDITKLVFRLVRESRVPLVLDADALNALRENPDVMLAAECPLILTPHEGEFARLLGRPVEDRIADACAFAQEYGCTVVLKGAATVMAFPKGDVLLNTTGGPSLAKGGSGDVLCGMLAALLCVLPVRKAVAAAVWLHGRAGDLCTEQLGENGVLACDVISAIPQAMREISERK